MIRKLLEKTRHIQETLPFRNLYELNSSVAQYRKEGLLYDDLIPDESELVQEALSRLDPQQQQQRLFRIRRALNLNMKKISLEPYEQTTAEQDVGYLRLILKQLESEMDTRLSYLNMTKIPENLAHRNRSS